MSRIAFRRSGREVRGCPDEHDLCKGADPELGNEDRDSGGARSLARLLGTKPSEVAMERAIYC